MIKQQDVIKTFRWCRLQCEKNIKKLNAFELLSKQIDQNQINLVINEIVQQISLRNRITKAEQKKYIKYVKNYQNNAQNLKSQFKQLQKNIDKEIILRENSQLQSRTQHWEFRMRQQLSRAQRYLKRQGKLETMAKLKLVQNKMYVKQQNSGKQKEQLSNESSYTLIQNENEGN